MPRTATGANRGQRRADSFYSDAQREYVGITPCARRHLQNFVGRRSTSDRPTAVPRFHANTRWTSPRGQVARLAAADDVTITYYHRRRQYSTLILSQTYDLGL